jgi:hypothetical protein
LQLNVSTSQLTLGRSPGRGGAAASWDKFENLSGPRWWVGVRRAHPAMARVPCTLTPSLSRVHLSGVDRASFRGRGGPRAAGPRVSRRSDSPTPARRVGSCLATGVESRSGVSTSQLTLGRSPRRGCAAQPGVRRIPPFYHAVGGGAGCAGPRSRTARWSPHQRRNISPDILFVCTYFANTLAPGELDGQVFIGS